MAEENVVWDQIWDELMTTHAWVLGSDVMVDDAEFDAENVLAEYAPVVENREPAFGDAEDTSEVLKEDERGEGVSGEEATRGGESCQEATGGETAVGEERDWWKVKDPNFLVEALGASDVSGVLEEDDVLSVVAVRK